ncbi:MAG: hypothetical protein IIB81_03595 [Nanoarchaeota archaeon]|nr:hypothetical protein [Nanoarchaeota archaeon]
MKIPKADKSLSSESGFGVSNILGLIFLLMGILLVLVLIDFNLPIDLGNFKTVLQYGAALGSILGGLSMLFRKKEITIK